MEFFLRMQEKIFKQKSTSRNQFKAKRPFSRSQKNNSQNMSRTALCNQKLTKYIVTTRVDLLKNSEI